jgi:hypothetical protein
MIRKNRWLIPFFFIPFLVLDLMSVNRRFLNMIPLPDEKAHFTAQGDVRFLKERAKDDVFRIWSVGQIHTTIYQARVKDNRGQWRRIQQTMVRGSNWYAYHFLQNAQGYQGAKLRLYEELIRREPGKKSIPMLVLFRLMNVKYVVSPDSLKDPMLALRYEKESQFEAFVYEILGSLPRVYFPRSVRQIEGKEPILDFMAEGQFDPELTAVVEKEPPFPVEYSGNNRVGRIQYDIHRITINVYVETPSLLVLSDMYYPAGWKAFVDGQETQIVKTNYAMRGVFLKPGAQQIEFIFKPQLFYTGLIISIITFTLLIGGVGVGWWLNRKKREKQKMTEIES